MKFMIPAMLVALTAPSLAVAEGDAAKGETLFGRCKACHQVGPEAKRRIGPVLNGVVGNQAAVSEDFKYSSAFMERSEEGLVWNVETLNGYLEDPRGYIPGNKMAFPGLKDEQDRMDVIYYLASFNADGESVDPAETIAALEGDSDAE